MCWDNTFQQCPLMLCMITSHTQPQYGGQVSPVQGGQGWGPGRRDKAKQGRGLEDGQAKRPPGEVHGAFVLLSNSTAQLSASPGLTLWDHTVHNLTVTAVSLAASSVSWKHRAKIKLFLFFFFFKSTVCFMGHCIERQMGSAAALSRKGSHGEIGHFLVWNVVTCSCFSQTSSLQMTVFSSEQPPECISVQDMPLSKRRERGPVFRDVA